jgi:hypothetical protein
LEAGLVDPATRLVFERNHPCELKQLLREVEADDDMIYLPVADVLLGKAFDRIPLRIAVQNHPNAPQARRTWIETKEFLKSMQPLVIEGRHKHNKSEFERARVQPDELKHMCLDFLL